MNLRLTNEADKAEANGQPHKPQAAQSPPRLLALDDLCKLLQRSRRSIENDLRGGRIGPEPIRIGRGWRPCVRFIDEQVYGWIRAGSPPAKAWRTSQSEANRGE